MVLNTICKEDISFNYQMTEKSSKIKGFKRFHLFFDGTESIEKIPFLPPSVPFLPPFFISLSSEFSLIVLLPALSISE